tara:strand:+ start:169 stop:879 length:711 start_codon:yes stop_codon:yes gene_type:complete
MKVLVACEFSGIVRNAFAAKGHDAWSCDILPTESPGNHIQDDVLKHLEEGWDLMIAHPPCTYLSNAGARHLYPKGKLNLQRYKLGLKAKEFFMALLNAPINKICLENPISSKIFKLPRHSQTIQPYEYGHPFSKSTRLWLKNLPLLIPTNNIKNFKPLLPSNTGGKKKGKKYHFTSITSKDASVTFKGVADAMANQWSIQSTKVPGNWFNKGGKDRQKNRAKFFKGFAKAMADQWQ